MKNYFLFVSLLVFVFLFQHNIISAQEKKSEWNIPAEYKNMKNPVKNTESNLTLGKQQYDKHCAGCHGKTGKGDGEKAKSFVNVTPANLSLDKFDNESDGVHFYKIKEGRNKLHSFKSKLDDESIWSILHYINTFK